MIINGKNKLAKELKVSPSTISRWLRIGLPKEQTIIDYKNTYIYDLDTVKQWIKDNHKLLKNTKSDFTY
jgi:DNA-binding transcriptional MerR regulator